MSMRVSGITFQVKADKWKLEYPNVSQVPEYLETSWNV